MPQPKRRKLSLDEQDGKDREKNRIAPGSDEGIEKQSAAGLAKEGCGSNGLQTTQPDKRASQSKSERKGEVATSSTMVTSVDDGKDAAATSSSTGDGCEPTERVSSSGRVIKQTNKGRCFSAALEAAQNKQSSSTGQGVGSTGQSTPRANVGKSSTPIRRKRGRKRRSWDLWSKFEQDAFFEGLFEHGKDFDAIHNLLAYRSKKRGIETSLIKTKEQVRHLYYRMWQKIAKHVDMGNNVKKETQEIYGLVNYYAIRKVFKRMDDRAVEHLNELILKGVSKVREPNSWGKKLRKKLRVLRTPVCNALKKLNNIEEVDIFSSNFVPDFKEEFVAEMPQQVTVELTPRSSAAWLKVHNLSHNPRVRFQVSVNRSLACLLEYLQKKWKGPTDRLRSGLREREEADELVVFPHHSYTLQPVTLSAQRATSVDCITFSSYRHNVLSSPPAGSSRWLKKEGEDLGKAGDVLSDGDGGQAGADLPRRSRSARKGGEEPRPGGDVLSDGDGTEVPWLLSAAEPPLRPVKTSAKVNLLSAAEPPFRPVKTSAKVNLLSAAEPPFRPVKTSAKVNLLSAAEPPFRPVKTSAKVNLLSAAEPPFRPVKTSAKVNLLSAAEPPFRPVKTSAKVNLLSAAEPPFRPVKTSAKVNLLPKLSDPAMQGAPPPCDDENAMFPDAPLFFPPPPTTTTTTTAAATATATAREDGGALDGAVPTAAETSSWTATNSTTCDSEEPKGTEPSPDTSPLSKERGRVEERGVDMRELMGWASKGFTPRSCRLVTLARLSLMLAKSSHIRLEYDWQPSNTTTALGVAAVAPPLGIVGHVERLTNMLRRLSHLANLEYRDLVQRAKLSGGGTMSQCTLCGHSLEKTTRKKTTCDVATETEPLEMSVVQGQQEVPEPVSEPSRLSGNNGSTVEPSSKFAFLTHLKTPDTDGVFRVPMPITVPMRGACPHKTSTQATVGQLNRPPDSVTSKFGHLGPYKRRPKRKPVVCQRSLLPKMPSSNRLILVPQNLLQPLSGAVTPSSSLQSGLPRNLLQPLSGAVTPSSSLQSGLSQNLLQPLSGAVTPSSSLQSGLSQMVLQPFTQQTEVAMGDSAVSSSIISMLPAVTSTVTMTLMTPAASSAETTTTVSSTMTCVSSSQMHTGMTVGSLGGLLGENSVSSSDLFACHLDMPVFVSPNTSPAKCGHQVMVSSVSSPSLASMLDISMAAPSNQGTDAGDKFLEMVTAGNAGFSGMLKSPLKVECSLGGELAGSQGVNMGAPSLCTPQHPSMHTPRHPLASPSICSPLKSGADTQWLSGQVPELSLSEFEDSPVKKSMTSSSLGENGNSLDHPLSLSRFLQSPVKKSSEAAMDGVSVAMPTLTTSSVSLSTSSFIPAPPSLFGESSQDSLVARLDVHYTQYMLVQVDTALQSVMMESSIDYSSKFERLAEHLADNTDISQPNM